MHTLGTYQTGAVRNAEDLDTDRLALNLMIALGEMAKLTIAAEDANTNPLPHVMKKLGSEKEASRAAIGAIMFNAAVLADRFGIDLGELAEVQLAKMERITNSGRLRMMAGGGEYEMNGVDLTLEQDGARFMKLAIDELRDTECYCGRKKVSMQTFCKRDYYALPTSMRRALYSRIGEGYYEAYQAARKFLFEKFGDDEYC